VVATDTAEHLSLMNATVQLNAKHLQITKKNDTATNKHEEEEADHDDDDDHHHHQQQQQQQQYHNGSDDYCCACRVSVQEYLWGSGTLIQQQQQEEEEQPSSSSSSVSSSSSSFDLIIGSDLAYRDELHDPLIAAFQEASSLHCSNNGRTCTARTSPIILLGVTMNDTKPIFFEKLVRAGFHYEKLADHLLEPQFRGGRQFGIFVIRSIDEQYGLS
jgi:hypothetical protein